MGAKCGCNRNECDNDQENPEHEDSGSMAPSISQLNKRSQNPPDIRLLLRFESGLEHQEKVKTSEPVSVLQRIIVARLLKQTAGGDQPTDPKLSEMRSGDGPLALLLPLQFSGETLDSSATWKNLAVCPGAVVQVKEQVILTEYKKQVQQLASPVSVDLYTAARSNNLAVLRSVLDVLPNLAAERDPDGCTLLHHATRYSKRDSHLELVQLLLAADVGVDARDNERATALHLVGSAGDNPEIAKILLHAGADIHAQTAAGFTPSYFATIKKRPGIAKVLREQPKWFLGSEQSDDK